MTAPADTNLREALEPFVRAGKTIAARPHDYPSNRIAMIGGLEDACDLTKQHFVTLLSALASEPVAGTETEALTCHHCGNRNQEHFRAYDEPEVAKKRGYEIDRGMQCMCCGRVQRALSAPPALVTEDDGTGDVIYPGQTGAEAAYRAPAPAGREAIASELARFFPGKQGLRDQAADAILALGATVTPQVLGAAADVVEDMVQAWLDPDDTRYDDYVKAFRADCERLILYSHSRPAPTPPAPGAAADRAKGAMAFCEWLQGYFKGDLGKEELTAFEANQIRAELNERFVKGSEVSRADGGAS